VKNELVVKDNALINASYNLDTTEQRLILLAIVQARELSKHVDANSTLEVHAHHYMKQFNVDKHAAYEGLKTQLATYLSANSVTRVSMRGLNRKR